jgi:NitT/TauT family transport system permease protein
MTATAVTRTPVRPARRSLGARVAPPVVLAVVLVAAWWAGAVIARSAVFPTPLEALRSLRADLGTSSYDDDTISSLRLLGTSYLAAVLIGTVAGMTLGLSAFWSAAVLPVCYAFNSIPKIALYPIFLLLLGLGDVGKGGFAFVSGVVPMFLIAAEATAGVSRLHLKLAASLRLNRIRVLRQIVVPSVLPSLATGLRLTFGLTFLGLILAEMFSGTSGLGYELMRNVALVQMGNIVGEVVMIAVLALLPTLALQFAERRIYRRFGGVA